MPPLGRSLILAFLMAGCSYSPSPSASPSLPGATAAQGFDQAGTFGGGLWITRGADLFLSTDGGASWRPRPMPSAALSVFVVNDQLGWSLAPGARSTLNTGDPNSDVLNIVVSETTDGGLTWHSTAIEGNYADTHPVLTFADATHGFVVTAPQRFSDGIGTVLATEDGGRSWRQIGTAQALGALVAAQPGRDSLWAGADAWAGGAGPLLLQVSRDGGATWAAVNIPGFIGARSPDTYLLGPPVFLSALDGVVAVVASENLEQVRFVHTADGGGSWSATTPVLAANFADPAVLAVNHWMVPTAEGASIAETTDGGASWHQIDAKGISGPIMWLGFTDVRHGAALVQTGNSPVPPELFVTNDGGNSWVLANLER
jgi:photosystem II stability/assembly factor-like uncharacterized protein